MNDLHILAFETSSNVCGVALLSRVGGRVRLRTMRQDGRAQHAERILPMAEDLLADAGVDRSALTAVAFGQGPGGFTGLRVACGVAQGMALALGIPVVPVSSLMAVAAQQAGESPDGCHVVLQDARMSEVYAAAYRYTAQAGWQTTQAPILLAVADIPLWLAHSAALWGGTGLQVHGDALLVFEGLAEQLTDLGYQVSRGEDGEDAHAQVAMIARLAVPAWEAGGAVPAEQAAPIYVRDKVAYTTEERERGFGGNPQAPALSSTLHVMSESDLDEVVAIERLVQAFPWQRNHFADGLVAGYQGWVLRQQGGMVGFAMVMDAPDMVHLLVIGVRPEAQRHGAGARLLAQCEAHAQARGRTALTLEVRPSNEQAIAFYRQHGFDHVGTRKDYYPLGRNVREDAWIMTKTWAEQL